MYGMAYVSEGTLNEFTASKMDGGEHKPKVIKNVEISESIVSAACALVAAKNTLNHGVGQSWDNLIGKR